MHDLFIIFSGTIFSYTTFDRKPFSSVIDPFFPIVAGILQHAILSSSAFSILPLLIL